MIFTDDQIIEILEILEYQSAFLIATNIGTDMLTPDEVAILESFDMSVKHLYDKFPPAAKAFFFGRLSELIGDVNAKAINYTDFKEYLFRGQYIPLSRREKIEYDLVRKMSTAHIRGLGTKIKHTVEGIIIEENIKYRSEYEKVLKDELSEGVVNKRALTSIISKIGHITGNWEKDWGRIVDTEMNNIFQSGRAQTMVEKYGEDTKVYKLPYDDACRHCIKLYLTNGIGSKPRVFRLDEMISFGTNIGKKVADWKPVLGSVHPHCFNSPTTKILSVDGYKNIIDIKVGDLVLTHKNRFRKVTSLSKREMPTNEKTFDIEFLYKTVRGKKRVGCLKHITGGHPIYIDGNWVKASDLKIGDILKFQGLIGNFKNIPVEIIDIKEHVGINHGYKFLHNFSVEEDESYIADGIAVHNCRCILFNIPKGQEWNKELGLFEYPKEIKNRVKRKSKIKIEVGNKKFLI